MGYFYEKEENDLPSLLDNEFDHLKEKENEKKKEIKEIKKIGLLVIFLLLFLNLYDNHIKNKVPDIQEIEIENLEKLKEGEVVLNDVLVWESRRDYLKVNEGSRYINVFIDIDKQKISPIVYQGKKVGIKGTWYKGNIVDATIIEIPNMENLQTYYVRRRNIKNNRVDIMGHTFTLNTDTPKDIKDHECVELKHTGHSGYQVITIERAHTYYCGG